MQKTLGTRKQIILQRLLKERREARGLTQRQLAEKLDTDHHRIGGYERGERRLDLGQLHEYVEALDMSLIEFIQLYLKALEDDKRADQ